MTPEERAYMRATLSGALRKTLLPDGGLDHPGTVETAAPDPASFLERFEIQLTSLGGAVHAANSAGEIATLVAGLASREGSMEALMWDEASLPVPGLASALAQLGVQILPQPPELVASHDQRHAMARASVGITGAHAALAETASVVLVSGPGRSRLTSLLPPIHVALVRRADLLWSLPMMAAARPELMTAGANVVCISGPSRTADIEHTLSRGVHGPREVHVVFVD